MSRLIEHLLTLGIAVAVCQDGATESESKTSIWLLSLFHASVVSEEGGGTILIATAAIVPDNTTASEGSKHTPGVRESWHA